MKNSLYTTVNSGKYKGKKLELPSLKTTRSTKSIIKESFFNTVQFDIVGKIFVEAFAGSGSIGLEALSRGAKKVYFFEKDRKAYDILLKNIKSLECKECVAFNADTFEEFGDFIKSIDKKAYFYFDPPFEIREGMEDIYLKVYKLIKQIPCDICELVAIEHMSTLKVPDTIGAYQKKKTRKFGKTSISYFYC
ncbi:MAG: 16S rRNA (guanine(966)-N(2))-methyltransferase RsmD [Epsilonproteobacteria bacterium]|nr:16S rRNA (guanine(966)-N(2))-methyltransferase RsmD [Campylobacterota bacterium]